MMCTTVLHGGVCHRTSTPHKSGNKGHATRNDFGNDIVDDARADAIFATLKTIVDDIVDDIVTCATVVTL